MVTVDARGHRCPTPTLRLRRALDEAAPGAVVLLLADDPMARIDAPHFVREAGHDLIETGEAGGTLSFRVRKRA
jgi:tRNA 2-thiouridine synthesizing protein A